MTKRNQPCNPEIWGGIECTIARIKDGYRDQLQDSGHYSRPSDIAAIAELGIRTIRYPVLWERQQPTLSGELDWTWADAQLNSIRAHGIRPVLGLLHHGSGPAFTSLDSSEFANYFADYAGKVAARYPWVDHYTPINEPLTTARFSGLYGFWYPHERDDRSFLRMLVNQIRGVAAAMKAIRKVNPSAKLVQTEDLSKTHSTSLLAYQAEFENQRRWLTYDLLCGKVDRSHSLWSYLLSCGIKEGELAYLIENPCVPDILGVNYYVTSERWLDERLENYPASVHGGNGRHVYADVAAIHSGRCSGLGSLLQEAYDRYQLPIAITEVHIHCTREEQVRWLSDVWKIACRAKQDGVDIRAVTGWALLGAYDWDSLLTRRNNHYETGAFSVRQGVLRLTAVGHLLKSLAAKAVVDHPLFESGGWWNRDAVQMPTSKSVLLCGPAGEASRTVIELCRQRGIECMYYPYEAYIPPEFALRETFLQSWGVIEITDEKPGSTLRIRCHRWGLPYASIPPSTHPVQGIREYQDRLDLFVDEAIAMACVYPDVRRQRKSLKRMSL